MRLALITAVLAMTMGIGWIGVAWAVDLNGLIRLGGIIIDDEDVNDFSTVQETYNLEEGFSVTQLRLTGKLNETNFFHLDLEDINLESRKGRLLYRVPGHFKLRASFDEHHQVFDPERAVESERKDWRFQTSVTPVDWLNVSANYNLLNRDGNRLSFPAGTNTALGNAYDYTLQTGRIESRVQSGRRAIALAYDFSDFTDDLTNITERQGQIVSARLHTPDPLFERQVTHVLRAAWGKQELTTANTEYTLKNLQYTGVIRPYPRVQFRYNFYANRIDDESTNLETDRLRNGADVVYAYRYGTMQAGYSHELNDDDRTLTRYDIFRLGVTGRYQKRFRARINWASRNKEDEENLTLLREVETENFRAEAEVSPRDEFSIGTRYAKRQRQFNDIGVDIDGETVGVFGRLDYAEWGGARVDYTYASDEYTDRVGAFDVASNIVTGRVDFVRIPNLALAGGVTYIEVKDDLDIEKSIVFVEGRYTILDHYHFDVRYNVYNYDDFILLDRYYTANVVWLNVGYDFTLKQD